jgi:WD40 repeat protein
MAGALFIANANEAILQGVTIQGLLTGHEGAVTGLAMDQGAKTLFSSGVDKTVRQWNLAERKQVRSFTGPTDAVHALSLAADDGMLFAGSADKNAYVWKLAAAEAVATMPPTRVLATEAPIRSVSASGDGSRLATAGADKLVTVWDVPSGLILEQLAGHTESVLTVSLSSDGKTLLSGGADKTARWWQIAAQRVVKGDEQQLRAVHFLKGDDAALVTLGETSGITRWSLETAEPTLVVKVDALRMSLAGPMQDPVTITAAGIVQRWSGETGELVTEIKAAAAPGQGALLLSVLANGSRVAVGKGSQVQLFDLDSGELLEAFPAASPLSAMALSSDGSRLMMGLNSDAANLFNFPVSVLAAWRIDQTEARAHVLSPDGQFLFATGTTGIVQMLRLEDGELVRTFGATDNMLRRLAISPNGELLAAASQDKAAFLWKVNPENADQLAAEAVVKPLISLVHPAPVTSLDFSNNSSRLVTGCQDGRSRVWNSADGMPLQWFSFHQGPCLDVDYKDDQTFASGGMDKQVRLQATSLTGAYRVFEGPVVGGQLLANGTQLLAAGDDKQLVLMNLANGQTIRSFEGAKAPFIAMAAAANGTQLAAATADNKLMLWTISDGQLKTQFTTPSPLTILRFSSDNQKLAAVTEAGQIVVYSTGDEVKQLYQLSSDQPIVSLVFQDDNRHLLTGHDNGLVRQWLYASPDPVKTFTGHGSSIYGLAFNHDARIFASASLDQTVRVWDIAAGTQLKQLSGHQGAVYSVAFSPDGSLLVSCGADKTLRLWDVLGGRQLKQVSAADAGLYSITVNADGKRVAVAGLDKKIRIFDLLTGKLLNTLERHDDFVYRVRYNASGTRLLSCGYGGRVIVWNAANSQPLFEQHLNRVTNDADLAPDGSRIIIAGGNGIGQFADVPQDSR